MMTTADTLTHIISGGIAVESIRTVDFIDANSFILSFVTSITGRLVWVSNEGNVI